MDVRRFCHLVIVLLAIAGTIGRAHAADLPRIATLWPGDVHRWNNAFLDGLRENGYVDGVTATIQIHATGQQLELGPTLARQVVSLDPQVIYAAPGILAKHVLRELERTHKDIPVVVFTSDPVGEELVPAAARHGKNVTGVGTRPDPQILTKHLQLIKDLVPKASRIAYFLDTSWYITKYYEVALAALEQGARDMGITVVPIEVPNPEQLEAKFSEAARKQVQAAIVPGGPIFAGNRDRVTRIALKHRLPVIYGDELYAYSGGLISYGTSVAEQHRRAADMVAKILRGARASEIPVEYPTRFRLIVNLPAAKSLGLEVPQLVLLQAEEVIR
jgi:putative ABC transport system substrate-binding protein